jgi:hypothetical protein
MIRAIIFLSGSGLHGKLFVIKRKLGNKAGVQAYLELHYG